MKIFQLILLCGCVASLLTYLRFFRSELADRFLGLALFGSAATAVIWPDTTTVIAHYFGIGRGTDLIFYLYGCASVFLFVILSSKIAQLSRVQVRLIRAMALQQAVHASNDRPAASPEK